MTERISLLVDGRKYSGWSAVSITRGIEQLCGSFDLMLSAGQNGTWPIGEGDECSVQIDGQTVITGFIDVRRVAFGVGEHSVRVTGRDRAADLVDCSVLLDRWEFSNVSVLALAQKICAPYNIGVSLQPGLVLPATSIPKKYAIDPGDTAQGALENLCRVAGVFPVSDGRGGVVLTRASSERCATDLVQGKNVLSASGEFNHAGRFRSYLVLGQHKGTDTLHVDENDWKGSPVSLVKGFAEDRDVRRVGRNLVIRPEANTTTAQANARAQWEATVRVARSDTVTVTVQGWQQRDRSVWPINRQVVVDLPALKISGTMLIASQTLSFDGGGELTTLVLRRPTAFLPLPVIKAGLGTKGWKELRGGV